MTAPTYLADRRRIAAVRPAAAPARPTSRPTVSRAEVVTVRATPAPPRAMDAVRMTADHRLNLPRCLAAIGWRQGDAYRVWTDRGVAELTAGSAGRGRRRTVGAAARLSVGATAARAMGAPVGASVLAAVFEDDDRILVVSSAAMLEAVGLMAVPEHLRRLLERLAGVGPATAGALGRLADKLTDEELDQLSSVSVEQLHEVGVLGADAPGRGREAGR